MDLQIVSTQMIKPSVPTPHHLRNYDLSFLDQIIPSLYVPLTLFYNTKFEVSKISEIHNHLKKSLAETLAIFYPLAGRVRDLVSIDCNDQGVRYVEATAKCTLSEYLKRPHLNSLNKFLPFEANVLKEGKDNILMSLQVTILECGGLVIGVCLFHRVCDFATVTLFLKTWADLFCGNGDKNIELHLDMGSSLFPALSSFPEDYESNAKDFFFSERNSSITRRFVFDASSVATLRAKATSENIPNPSRIEALTGFITQRLMQQVL